MTADNGIQTFRVGLTGGIASGKSTAERMFADLGVPIIDTDVIAREVVEPGRPALEQIARRFGDHIIDRAGKLNRRKLRELVFSDDIARLDLEAILHPRIAEETRRQSAAAGGAYQIIVIPLLVGSRLLRFIDRVLVVDCDENTQIERLMVRDADTRQQAQRILAAQASREERLAIADDVIRNDSDLQRLRDQVINLNEVYRHLAAHPDPRERSPETP